MDDSHVPPPELARLFAFDFDPAARRSSTTSLTLTRSTTVSSCRPSSRGKPSRPLTSRGLTKSRSTMISVDEYEALPPSVQKKYFSSVERLRIFQEAAAQKRKKQPSTKTAHSLWHPAKDQSARPDSVAGSTASHLPALPRPAASTAHIDEDQALRFLMLPDKVKRANFSPEELHRLTTTSARVLGVPTIAGVSGRDASLTSRRPSIQSQWSSRSPTFLEMGDATHDMDDGIIESDTSPANSLDGRAAGLDAYRCGRRASVRSTQSAYPQCYPPPIRMSREQSRRSLSVRRSSSLTPIPLPPPALAPAVPPLPSPSTLVSMRGWPSPVPSVEAKPVIKYYKDSQARQQVRDLLTSPEKFDEALEFGFLAGADRSASATPSLEPPLSDQDIDRSVDDEASQPRSPVTPSTTHGAWPVATSTTTTTTTTTTAHHKPSIDSGVGLALDLAPPPPPPPPPTKCLGGTRSLSPVVVHGREMTLRMTLTRPDLRAAPEDELYAVQRSQVSGVEVETTDPLALAALPVCDDHTGAHGAFAVHPPSSSSSRGLRRVWRSFRGRHSSD